MTVFYNKDGQAVERTPCQVFTRVMGYIRSVSGYNIGKKSEFYSRKYFKVEEAGDDIIINNQAFIKRYGLSK